MSVSSSEKVKFPSQSVAQILWSLKVPLLITHASASPAPDLPDQPNLPFITSVPRFSYLAFLLPQLTAFFNAPCTSFHYEEVALRNLSVGLLVDLYQPEVLPWKLVVGGGVAWDVGDGFVNGVKEADFVRNGNAKQIMSMSKEHTTALWNAVRDNDYHAFHKVNSLLLNPSTPLKHIPLRIYIPTTTTASSSSYKTLQTLVPLRLTGTASTPQTIGGALRSLLPDLFPSSRDPVLANVVIHGASVPFAAPLEEVMREAAYPDGWVGLVVVVL